MTPPAAATAATSSATPSATPAATRPARAPRHGAGTPHALTVRSHGGGRCPGWPSGTVGSAGGPGRRHRGRDGRPGGRRTAGHARPRRHRLRAGRPGRRQGRHRRAATASSSTPGPSLLTLPAVYRDLFVKTGRPIEDSIDLVEVDPAFRYRFPAVEGVGDGAPSGSTCPTPRAAGTAPRWTPRWAPARAGLGRVPRPGARRSGRSPAARSSSHPSVGRATWSGSRDVRLTSAPSRRGRRCAPSVASTCATRGCGCCSTATRPTPGRTLDAPRQRWPSCPTSSRRSARGTCGAASAGWRTRCTSGRCCAASTCAPAPR